jgi:hypothetical protein
MREKHNPLIKFCYILTDYAAGTESTGLAAGGTTYLTAGSFRDHKFIDKFDQPGTIFDNIVNNLSPYETD